MTIINAYKKSSSQINQQRCVHCNTILYFADKTYFQTSFAAILKCFGVSPLYIIYCDYPLRSLFCVLTLFIWNVHHNNTDFNCPAHYSNAHTHTHLTCIYISKRAFFFFFGRPQMKLSILSTEISLYTITLYTLGALRKLIKKNMTHNYYYFRSQATRKEIL